MELMNHKENEIFNTLPEKLINVQHQLNSIEKLNKNLEEETKRQAKNQTQILQVTNELRRLHLLLQEDISKLSSKMDDLSKLYQSTKLNNETIIKKRMKRPKSEPNLQNFVIDTTIIKKRRDRIKKVKTEMIVL